MIQWGIGKACLVLLYRDMNHSLAKLAEIASASRPEIIEALEYLDEHPVHEAVRLLNLRGRRA